MHAGQIIPDEIIFGGRHPGLRHEYEEYDIHYQQQDNESENLCRLCIIYDGYWHVVLFADQVEVGEK